MKRYFKCIALLLILALIPASNVIAAGETTTPAVVPVFLSSLSFDRQSPQLPGTAVAFSAAATGGTKLYYEFWVNDGTSWNIAQPYSTLDNFVWTPSKEDNYQIRVWVKDKNSANDKDVQSTVGYTISSKGSAQPVNQGDYMIEPDRWGIDGNPVNNSNGINNALIWAYQSGYSRIIFPAGEYVISEYSPINIQNMRNVTIDLNGAALRINTNGLLRNEILFMSDLRNVNLINGTVLGDINTHDYTTNPGSTEGNLGVVVGRGVTDCQLDNLLVKDITGWGIVTSNGADYAKWPNSILKSNLGQGRINLSTGARLKDSTRICTIKPIDISQFTRFEDKFFILGYDKGSMGNPFMAANNFDVVFYDKDKKVIGSLTRQLIYKRVLVPDNTVYADFVFYQSAVPAGGDSDFNGTVLFITHYAAPTNFRINNCTVDGCRSLGMAVCGGDNMTVRNCTIKNTKGLAPGYAVDFEDGWEFMNDIRFKDNKFENNANDVVVCAGDNALFQGNSFTGTVYMWPRATNYMFISNIFDSKAMGVTYQYSTDTVCKGNTYINTSIETSRSRAGAKITLDNEKLTNTNVNGMSNGDELTNSTITGDSNLSLRLAGGYRNCTISNVQKGELISAKFYNCTVSNIGYFNCQGGPTVFDGCKIDNSTFNTVANTTTVQAENCAFTDSRFEVATWGAACTLSIRNCNITESAAGSYFVNISAGKMAGLSFKNNTVKSQGPKPVFNMYDTGYSVPKGNITLEKNTFEISDYEYVFDGVSITSGVVNFKDTGNKIIGTARMLNPQYMGNRYFKITH